MVQRVAVLALDGVTDSGVSVALDVLRAANAIVRRSGGREPFSVERSVAQYWGPRAAAPS